MNRLSRRLLCSAMLAGVASQADADITISTNPTQNVICSAGVCTPTSASAVLNAGDLESLLASGSVEVTTTGSGVQANNIVDAAGITWSAASTLTLDAAQSLVFDGAVAVTGSGGLTLLTNDGGSGGALSFGASGNVTFQNLSSALSINGTGFFLKNSISSLASAITVNPSGAYALAQSYDASGDGTYSAAPIGTVYSGTFEGLGNAISNLSINSSNEFNSVGLFSFVDRGVVRDLYVTNASATGASENAGLFAGAIGSSQISGVHTSGTVSVHATRQAVAGGLLGGAQKDHGQKPSAITNSSSTASVSVNSPASNQGGLIGTGITKLVNCYATGDVTGTAEDTVSGGLAGSLVTGAIQKSYATGTVAAGDTGMYGSYAGGLIGYQTGAPITNSYAVGNVSVGQAGTAGGLIGFAQDAKKVKSAYSAGAVSGGTGSTIGGFVGNIYFTDAGFVTDYWDTDTSGTSQGIGNMSNISAITGLTTSQLQSGLPAGFGKKNWAENATINNGYPYLIGNPPN